VYKRQVGLSPRSRGHELAVDPGHIKGRVDLV